MGVKIRLRIFTLTLLMASSWLSIPTWSQDNSTKMIISVPDEATAVSIAVSAFIPIYGKEQIDSERPFTAKLEGKIWRVEGTLPKGSVGGTATAWIDKLDGHIIKITHYK